MRGKDDEGRLKLRHVGITPAYAGKSWLFRWCFRCLWNHPRVCGEKLLQRALKSTALGSPPRMRGKEVCDKLRLVYLGITPAYAGKSRCPCSSHLRLWDHPRVCGEKKLCSCRRTRRIGSPPRMRGKAVENRREPCTGRITPAYAGKRRLLLCLLFLLWDHPRVCGEKRPPPRYSGTCTGITPAYAGKRLKRSRSTVSPVAIVPLFPSVCNKPVVSDGSPAVRDAPFFLPAENAVPASPACNLRSL